MVIIPPFLAIEIQAVDRSRSRQEAKPPIAAIFFYLFLQATRLLGTPVFYF